MNGPNFFSQAPTFEPLPAANTVIVGVVDVLTPTRSIRKAARNNMFAPAPDTHTQTASLLSLHSDNPPHPSTPSAARRLLLPELHSQLGDMNAAASVGVNANANAIANSSSSHATPAFDACMPTLRAVKTRSNNWGQVEEAASSQSAKRQLHAPAPVTHHPMSSHQGAEYQEPGLSDLYIPRVVMQAAVASKVELRVAAVELAFYDRGVAARQEAGYDASGACGSCWSGAVPMGASALLSDEDWHNLIEDAHELDISEHA